jgi:hypothetical protein
MQEVLPRYLQVSFLCNRLPPECLAESIILDLASGITIDTVVLTSLPVRTTQTSNAGPLQFLTQTFSDPSLHTSADWATHYPYLPSGGPRPLALPLPPLKKKLSPSQVEAALQEVAEAVCHK